MAKKSATKARKPKSKSSKQAKVIKKVKKPVAPKKAKKPVLAKVKKKVVTKVKTKKTTAKVVAKPKKLATKTKPPIKKTPMKPIAKPKLSKSAPAKQVKAKTSTSIAPYQETIGEEYMNLEQREHFRKILLHWKHQLMEEVDRTVHHMQDEAANFPDPNDRATQEEEFSLELRARDRERKLIKKIEEALEKLDHSEYGYCDACGIEIGVRRLEARPTATLCIDCKTIDEIREKSYG